MKILITTGDWSPTQVAMKSLAKRGHAVHLLSPDKYCAGFYSKYCSGGMVVPSHRDRDDYADALIKILSEQKFDLLLPISDQETEILSEERDRILLHTRMFLPSRELISLALFKDRAYRFMQENNIAIPATHFPQSPEDVARLAESVSYPCVVKKPRGSSNQGNSYFYDKKGLKDYYRNFEGNGAWPVIQEFVPGDFYGATAIAQDGEILDCFMYTACQKYARNGTPPYGESIVDKDFFEIVQKLIKLLKWHGVINLDFIKGRDGEFKFLEINPRLPGTLGFIYASGLDFPSLYVDLALGKECAKFKGFSYRPGMKFRFLLPAEMIYTLKNKKHFLKLLINSLNPFLVTDLPWDDPKLFMMKLKHIWWYWRDKRHLSRNEAQLL